jgi:hypothetical protein
MIHSFGEFASIVARALALPPLWLLLVYLVSVGFQTVVSITCRLGATKAVAHLVAFLTACVTLFVATAVAFSFGGGSPWTPWIVGLLAAGFCYGVGAAAVAAIRSSESDFARAGFRLVGADEALEERGIEEVSA